MSFNNFRLKFKRFFRTYKNIIIIAVILWTIVFLINLILKNMPKELVPETTYEIHTSIMNDSSSTPNSLQKPIEEIIDEYIEYCNDGNYHKAFNMLSEDCREYGFDNNIQNFMSHVLVKMPTPKKYSIQNYSNMKYGNKKFYIYEIKYTDDFLATGLTNSSYSFTQENITFYQDENDLEMNVGDYIYHANIKSISENEYLKIDVIDKVVNYSVETYTVKFTNRSDYTIVISDGQENEEITLTLPNEVRKCSGVNDLVLVPHDTITMNFTFPKFVDDGDISQSIDFSAIRVMEKYSGTENVEEEVIQSEIDNAIAKFSMNVTVAE